METIFKQKTENGICTITLETTIGNIGMGEKVEVNLNKLSEEDKDAAIGLMIGNFVERVVVELNRK